MKPTVKSAIIGLSSIALALGIMAGPAMADSGHGHGGEGRHGHGYSYSNYQDGRHYRYYRDGRDGRDYRYYKNSNFGNRESDMNYSNWRGGDMGQRGE